MALLRHAWLRAGWVVVLARLLEVRTGRVATLNYRDRTVPSAFLKQSRTGPVAVSVTGLDADEQGDQRVHGGAEKAMCVYPVQHYEYWRTRLAMNLKPGAFGENLVVSGLYESEVQLGDRFAIGDVEVEVSMPRRSCFKLAAVHGLSDLPAWLQETGRTGFYFRVLRTGLLAAGDEVVATGRVPGSVTVGEANRVMNVDRHDLAAAARLAQVATMPEKWRTSLAARVAKVP